MESTTDDLRDLNLDADEDYEEAEVRLAFLREPDGTDERQRHRFPDKAGGAPAWLDPVDLPTGEARLCGFCGEPLRFALQVYAPLPPAQGEADEGAAHYHRALFVFMCPAMACPLRDQREQRAAAAGGSRRRSVRVFRCQLPEDSAFYYRPADAEEPGEVARCTGVEAAPLCGWCGTWGADRACGTCAAAAGFCSEKHLERHRLRCGRGGGGGDDDADAPSASAWPECAMYAVDEKPLASEAEDSSTSARGHGGDDDADIAAWMDAFEEADEDTACWASFQARVSPEPEQLLRYSVAAGGAPACPRCGGARRYELQLMPQLLHYLGVEASRWTGPPWPCTRASGRAAAPAKAGWIIAVLESRHWLAEWKKLSALYEKKE
ncbi:Programmed cell death protein 2, C-terminal domain containing protein, expressed [Panicum miliaceum]|uniref:Programmed cell death protein 2, C-terminal domain containing protein, expressed n=1 Tax=Panicum miliaceum TaxID=4540 RepID=A0A3L6TC81_PANMI|nr:Programmed cell death protein 2, C-terminal domain containing protein, expressed [Panicum miliaceum]